MPFKDSDREREDAKERMRRYRARKQAGDEEWRQKEKERKASWYEANKEKKAHKQRPT